MTESTRARGNAPWVVAGALALLAAALVLLLVRTNAVARDNDRNAGRLLEPTAAQRQAVQSGAVEAANLLTLSRAKFEADYARALAGATGDLRKDLVSKKQAYLSAMTAGKFDLKATVEHSAFESEAKGKVLVLVTLNGAHVVDNVTSAVTTPQRIELTMVQQGGSWLAAGFTAVGVS